MVIVSGQEVYGGSMTPREKILRDGIQTFTTYGDREDLNVRILARQIIEQADAVEAGPSEEDKKRFIEILSDPLFFMEGEVHSEDGLDWMISKLQKYMG